MIISKVNLNDFYNAFIDSRNTEQFTPYGLDALYNLLEESSKDVDIELNVFALCSKFSEYEKAEDAVANYDNVNTLEELKDRTLVLELDNGGVVLQDF